MRWGLYTRFECTALALKSGQTKREDVQYGHSI